MRMYLYFDISMHDVVWKSEGEVMLSFEDGVVFDPSVWHFLAQGKVNLRSGIVVYIPDTLRRLIEIAEEDMEKRGFLEKFLYFFTYGAFLGRGKEEKGKSPKYDWEGFYQNLKKIELRSIQRKDIREYREEYEELVARLSRSDFDVEMSQKINLLGDVLAKTLLFSRKRGVFIVHKTRRVLQILREVVVTISIEIPKTIKKVHPGLDHVIERKNEIFSEIFDFSGGKFIKFFIGVTLSISGVMYPPLGHASIVFAFMDP